MKSLIPTVACALIHLSSLVLCPVVSGEPILELSSRRGALFLSVSILDASNKVIKSGQINGRGYEWFSVPPNGVSFQLKALGTSTDPQPLQKEGSTFVSVTPLDPTTYDLNTASGLGLKVRSEKPLSTGVKGYVFVGTLAENNETSEWRSIFLADAIGKRLDQPGEEPLTLAGFRKLVSDRGPVLTVDFPLFLRKTIGGDPVGTLRPGQKVRIKGISLHSENGKNNVFAEVETL